MKNETWQDFERLTLKIQQDISPAARLSHNEKLRGKSDAEHQCDVVLRAPVDQLEFVCVIECKDYSDPVGSEVMRAFVGKMLDLPVHQGILVSASGFTADALKLARQLLIKTYKLVDAQHVRRRHEALLPIVFISLHIENCVFKFFDPSGNPRMYHQANGSPVPPEKIYLRDTSTLEYRPVKEVLEELWDVALDARIPSPDYFVQTEPGKYLIYLGENRHEPVTLHAAFTPRITYHYNTISLAACQGFVDEQTGTFIPGEYETTPLDTHAIVKEWPATSEKAAVPFLPPVNFFYLCAFMHRKPRTPRFFSVCRTTGPPPDDAIEL